MMNMAVGTEGKGRQPANLALLLTVGLRPPTADRNVGLNRCAVGEN